MPLATKTKNKKGGEKRAQAKKKAQQCVSLMKEGLDFTRCAPILIAFIASHIMVVAQFRDSSGS